MTGSAGRMRVRAVLSWLAWLALAPAAAHAQSAAPAAQRDASRPSARVQVRTDTVLRSVPRYELIFDARGESSRERYYRRIDQLPLYQRVSLDARNLGDGRLDLHIQGFALADATLPDEGAVLNGDFALAYGEVRPLSALSLWGGRRFLTWGLPGGLHLDGGGAALSSELGLFAELAAGRPVTGVVQELGVHSEFEDPGAAYGARVGYRNPGKLSASVSYLERWSHGLRSDRVVGLSASARPLEQLDLSGQSSLDVREGLQEAHLQLAYRLGEHFEPELYYEHADPQKLLPSWSILSVFASEVYDEGAVALNTRIGPAVRARLEVGGRRSHLPGDGHAGEATGPSDDNGDDVHLGLSAEAHLHVRPAPYEHELVLEAGHRDQGTQRLLTGRVGVSFVVLHRLRLSPTFGVALDEDDGERSAWLGRAAADLPLDRHWESGLVVDFARTPLARGELRAMLRVSYQLPPGVEVD